MSKVRIELNQKGIRELLKSSELEAVLGEHARKIAGRCGDGYGYDTYQATTRVIASVFTEDPDAMRDNLKNNTILKAMQ